jgi:hypothetical protein
MIIDPLLSEHEEFLVVEVTPPVPVDHLELEEIGAEFDDPEVIVVLEGGMDDPDGIDIPVAGSPVGVDEAGWDLCEPLCRDETNDGEIDPTP